MNNLIRQIGRIFARYETALACLALFGAGCLATPAALDQVVTEPQWAGEVELPQMAVVVRDSTLTYISAAYGLALPEPTEAWTVALLSPEEHMGSTTYRLNLDRCSMTISYPVVAPKAMVFHVTFDDLDSGVHWAGEIDAGGQVINLSLEGRAPAESASTPVVG